VFGEILSGFDVAGQGVLEAGITSASQALTAARATGTELDASRYLAVLAEMNGKAGQAAEGLNLLAKAKQAAERADDHSYEAELYRLEGELSLQMGRALDDRPVGVVCRVLGDEWLRIITAYATESEDK